MQIEWFVYLKHSLPKVWLMIFTHIMIVSSHRIDTAEGSIASPVHHVDYPYDDHDKHNQDNDHWNSQLDNLH